MINPQVELYVKYPGESYSTTIITYGDANAINLTAYFQQTNWNINTQWGRQSDTATFYLTYEPKDNPSNTLLVPPLSQILVYDSTNNVTIFAGLVNDVMQYFLSPTLYQVELQCSGWQPYLAKAVTVSTWSGLTAGQVLLKILNPDSQGKTAYGVIAKSVTNGGFIYDDYPAGGYGAGSNSNPYTGILSFNGTTIQDVLTQLIKVASVTEVWGAYVDLQGNMHFQPGLTGSNTVTITDDVTQEGSTTLGHIDWDQQAYYEFNATDMRNNIILTGNSLSVRKSERLIVGVGGPPWQLLFTPDQTAGTSTISVRTPQDVYNEAVLGYNTPTIATVGPAANPPQTDFQFYTDANGVPWLGLGTLLSAGSYIAGELTGSQLSLGSEVNFSYKYPSTVLATVQAPYFNNNPYTGPNDGIWTEIINDSTLGDLTSIQNRGVREIVEYGYPTETFVFNTGEDFLGHISAGDVITITADFMPNSANNYTLGFTDQFVVSQCVCQASSKGGGFRTYQITAQRLFVL